MVQEKKQKTSSSRSSSNNENSKICAILAYIFPIGLIWYLADKEMKKDSFVKFHVYQSLVLAIAAVAIKIALMITSRLLFFMNLNFLVWSFFLIVHAAIVVLVILGIINAAKNQKKELPVIGKFGKLFKF